MRFLCLILCLIGIHNFSIGQPWLSKPYLHTRSKNDSLIQPNFYAIQKAFNKYEKKELRERNNEAKDITEEDEGPFAGWAQYKRWENHMEPRVYPTGDLSLPSTNYSEFQKYLASPFYTASLNNRSIPPANWTALGPTGSITNYYLEGAGRINFLRFDPVNTNKMWCLSPLGGLWKSIDGGANWTTNTDQLPIVGGSDVAINPLHPLIMYLATGDANGTGSQLTIASIGIFKSTDGGVTWPTASNTMNWAVSLGRNIYKLIIHPTRPDTVLAATTNGIYRTVDAGLHWIQMQTGQFTDIEFKPGHPNVVYATAGIFSGGSFYKSVDSGGTWSLVTNGLPLSTDVARLEIGVTPADTNYVYIVAVKKSTWDFYGCYRSVDGGNQFTLRATTPNILFGQAGSQAWYNLALGVSPIHKDTLLAGGTNLYRSLDGGTTWVKVSSETGGLIPFVHPDHHSITFLPGQDSIYFSGNDGGLFKTTNRGVTWNPINEGMQIAQMYKVGISKLHPYTLLTGHQDMATFIYNGSIWNMFTPNTGDGMESIYEHDNDSIRYIESYNGHISVSYNNYPLYHNVCLNNMSGVNGPGSWITPYVMHPMLDSTLLVGKLQVWRTTNGGQLNSFVQVGNVTGGATNVIGLAYAESNPNYMYAVKSNRVFVAIDGNTFTDKTGTLPVASVSITGVAVSNTDPKKVWVTFSGYNSANKVWYSNDGGDTWSNHSSGLPNIPVNCIVYQHASDDGIYVGTDVGVYYIDNSYSTWQSYFTALPNVDVEELEITYSIGKIRAATNGRGLWESPLAVPVPSTLTWVGSVSSDWNNPANWTPHAVPTIMQDVTIPDVNLPNFDPVVNVPGQGCKHLTLQTGANVTVLAGNLFTTKQN
ncbi:MAG: hypothetical protein ABJC12_02195 [Saprospiraceae bacterium]